MTKFKLREQYRKEKRHTPETRGCDLSVVVMRIRDQRLYGHEVVVVAHTTCMIDPYCYVY